MITVITYQVRPSISIPFFLEQQPQVSVLLNQFISSTQYLLEPPTFYIDLDGKRHVSIAKYSGYLQLQSFLSDLDIEVPGFMNARDSYNRINNISTSRNVSEN